MADMVDLEALFRRDVLGVKIGAAEWFQCAVIDRSEDQVPCACVQPENRDGGMPAGWWR